eukprot:Lithocolla_globosa_v1_NODE_3_length_14236_cov_22.745998.p15 type:complete len:120 gc:universal NODE_3_length_14236_cov_22.745998:5708-6067(+)
MGHSKGVAVPFIICVNLKCCDGSLKVQTRQISLVCGSALATLHTAHIHQKFKPTSNARTIVIGAQIAQNINKSGKIAVFVGVGSGTVSVITSFAKCIECRMGLVGSGFPAIRNGKCHYQ